MSSITRSQNIGTIAIEPKWDPPVIEIRDPYSFGSGENTIAILSIKGREGEMARRLLVRTTKGGYMTK